MWVLCRHENVSAQQYCGLEVGEETTRTIKQTIYNSKLFILMRKRIISLLALAMSAMVGSLPVMAQFDAAANGFDPDSKLILDASQLSSPASDDDEGKHIEWLVDDNVTTFWHSDWHGKVSGPHYIQDTSGTSVRDYWLLPARIRPPKQQQHVSAHRDAGSADCGWSKLDRCKNGGTGMEWR